MCTWFYKSRRGLVTTKFKYYIHIISGGQGLTGTTRELDSSPFLLGESMCACHWSQRQFSWLGFQMCRWGSMLVQDLSSLGEHASTNHGTFSFQVVGAGCPGLVGRACLFHMFSGNPLTIWWHQHLDTAFIIWWSLLVTASSEPRDGTFLTWFSGLN